MQKEIKTVLLKDLKPFGGNPRHNNKSAEMVAKSIKEFGYINPIIVDENLVILAGNTRYKALQILDYKDVEVLVVSGLTEQQKNGFVIADNRAGEFSKWNMSALERMLNNSELDEGILQEFGILSVKKTKKKIEEMIYGDSAPGNKGK
jgi:ParB-like chromosome segregation protein Spo0J